jgi:proteasome lid subunit RPN8/RPN11
MLTIPRFLFETMIAHAKAEAPNECCGLLAGRNGQISHIYRIRNLEDSDQIRELKIPADRAVRYFMDPRQLMDSMTNMRDKALDLLAIYHSHPKTEAYPSATDVRLAYYPESYYLIISLRDTDRPEANLYRILEGKITPESLKIVEDGR